MDYKYFVDYVHMPCCVMSVEKLPDDRYGEIRIICSNQAYKDVMGPAYYDNMIYYELVPKDNKFEDFVYRAAVLKQRMHSYVETKALGCWTDQTMIPLESDDPGMGYCQFIFEFTQLPESERMANVSMDVAETVIKSCVKLMNTDDFRSSVGGVLDDIMSFSGAQGSRIMLVDHDDRDAIVFAERNAENAWPTRGDEDLITYDLICTREDMIGVSNAVIVKDEHDMDALEETNPFWAGTLREVGVTSLVLIPLRRESAVIGYLYAVNFDVDKVVEIKELIELLSFFLSSEISNYMLMRKLERIGLVDALTGLGNRYAMTQRVNELKAMEPVPEYGIVSIDLNGLKQVNDMEGHEAGDDFIRKATMLLREVFSERDIFRLGGDEFTVIITGISRDDFKEKVKELKSKETAGDDVSFAVGVFWSDGSTDLITAFRNADKAMYDDKKNYYINNPDKRR